MSAAIHRPGRSWLLGSVALLAVVVVTSGCKWRRGGGGVSARDVIAFDLTQHAFEAERRYTSYMGGEAESYTERVLSAGDGKTYRVDLLELADQPRDQITDASELERFDRLESMLHEGGAHRVLFQRDYRVVDAPTFLRNYRVIPLDRSSYPYSLGPEAFMVFLIVPNVPDRPTFEVALSIVPGRMGFPLRYVEFAYDDTNGTYQLASEMEVLSLQFGTCRPLDRNLGPIQSRTVLPSVTTAVQVSPHSLLIPTYLPSGFQLLSTEEIVMLSDARSPGRAEPVTIYRFSFSDGLDRIEIYQHQRFITSANSPVQRGGTAMQVRSGSVVPVYRFGSIHGTSLFLDDLQTVIEGRVSYQRFADVVRSMVLAR